MLLFLTDNIRIPSHLWMRRMLDALPVRTLAVISNPGPEYRKKYKIVRIKRHDRGLKRAIKSKKITGILVQYLLFGTKYAHVWRKTKKPVWVYCHNHEAHWDFEIDLPENVRFIANSNQTKKQLLKRGIAEERITVQGLGVPTMPLPERNHARLNILSLGRLVECKNPDLTIKAFERACELGLNGTLTIAGYGPLAETCAELISASRYKERMLLTDVTDGDELRAKADVFTAHNGPGKKIAEEETYGVAFLEAMAAGLPVVTGRSGALPEIINEENGILFETGDIEAHAQALLSLQDQTLRERLGLAGREMVLKDYTLEKTTERLLSALDTSSSAE